MFLLRAAVLVALAGGLFSVFRKDILKLGRALKAPTETFLAGVRKELDGAVPGAPRNEAVAGVRSEVVAPPPLPHPPVAPAAPPVAPPPELK